MQDRTSRMMAIAAAALMACCALSCGREQKKNLEDAQRAFDRLEIGMSKQETCWKFGVTCDDPKPDLNYQKDYGMSFSQKEYQVTIWVRDDKLVRVELARPYYEGRTRTSGQGKETVIAEKGLPLSEIK